ncbi:Uncharacterised protein [Streptococcus pneumoniae]|nr:Uncharacterised protein [Streptococcus pneumoniae]
MEMHLYKGLWKIHIVLQIQYAVLVLKGQMKLQRKSTYAEQIIAVLKALLSTPYTKFTNMMEVLLQ